MPITRSEAMFFTGGLVAGVAVVAALPWLKKQYETLRENAESGEGMPAADLGRKMATTFEEFLKAAPGFAEAGKAGMAAGYDAARKMATAAAGSTASDDVTVGPTQAA